MAIDTLTDRVERLEEKLDEVLAEIAGILAKEQARMDWLEPKPKPIFCWVCKHWTPEDREGRVGECSVTLASTYGEVLWPGGCENYQPKPVPAKSQSAVDCVTCRHWQLLPCNKLIANAQKGVCREHGMVIRCEDTIRKCSKHEPKPEPAPKPRNCRACRHWRRGEPYLPESYCSAGMWHDGHPPRQCKAYKPPEHEPTT